MDDRLARYLRQQAELGGAEVYLSASAEGSSVAELEALPELVTVGAIISRVKEPVGAVQPAEDMTSIGVRPAEAPAVGRPSVESPAVEPPKETLSSAARAEPLPVDIQPPSPRVTEMPKTWPKWRKDAPPVPGPGLIITPQGSGVLGEDLAQLESLDAIAEVIRTCRKCGLCKGRDQTVPGEGPPTARLMCIGEGPGEKEDRTGRPFVGAAGALLDQILGAIDCPRETVFIANIVKCRPPQNRKPLPEEALACQPYLHRQIALVRPKVILALGGTAAECLLGVRRSLGDLRGQVHNFAGIPLVVTYHPAALLRNPNWKRPTWDDVRIARQLLDK